MIELIGQRGIPETLITQSYIFKNDAQNSFDKGCLNAFILAPIQYLVSAIFDALAFIAFTVRGICALSAGLICFSERFCEDFGDNCSNAVQALFLFFQSIFRVYVAIECCFPCCLVHEESDRAEIANRIETMRNRRLVEQAGFISNA